MAILALDHVNLRSRDPAATLRFFSDVLRMRIGPPPGRESMDEGGWVYDDGDRAIVHVGSAAIAYPTDAMMPFTPADGGGAMHHVALRCEDFEEMKQRLDAAGVAYKENHYPPLSLHQLFVRDPNGILFELNFRD